MLEVAYGGIDLNWVELDSTLYSTKRIETVAVEDELGAQCSV